MQTHLLPNPSIPPGCSMPRPANEVQRYARRTAVRNPAALGRRLSLLLLALAAFAGYPQAQQDPKYTWDRQYYGVLDGRQVLLFGDTAYYGKPAFGVLTGDGRTTMLLGRVDGSIARFENTGPAANPTWRLLEERISANFSAVNRRVQRTVDVGSHAAPALVDIDGDGDLDLIVGAGDGRLFFFRNSGTKQLPVFELVTERLVAPEMGEHLVPVFQDINADRAPDLILGNGAGDVYLLINQGRIAEPAFCSALPPTDPDVEPRCKPAPRLIGSIKPEIHAAPSLVDWDGDGDFELFVGKSDGTIDYYENKGTRTEPDWRLTQPRFLAIDEGGYAAPAFMDVNGDGKPDLIVGNSSSALALYTNKDTGKPLDVWKVTGNVLSMEHFARGLERVVIASGDVDGDGDRDLVIGDRNGGLMWIENAGTAKEPRWRLKQENLLPGTQRRSTAPLLVDIDGDGDLDLVVGGADGRLWLLRNTGTAKQPRWAMENTNYGGVDVGANSIPVTVDIDGDGKLDLFVGNGRGFVIYYHNDGTAKDPDFRLVSTRFGELAVGQSAAPAFFDWNEDKQADLVIGNRDGKLALMANSNPAGDTQFRAWRSISAAWEAIQVRGYSTPHFADVNGDGKPDLLVGDGDGNIRLYLNGGNDIPKTAAQPAAPGATAGTPAPGAPAPAGVAVQAVPPPPRPGAAPTPGTAAAAAPGTPGGAAAGAKQTPTGATQPPEEPLEEASDKEEESGGADTQNLPVAPQYALASPKFADLQLEGKVSPAFGDLDGDGDQDLVVGTEKGQLRYYRNVGTAKEPKFSQVPDFFTTLGPFRGPVPLVADVDGDGIPDILIGNEEGKVFLLKNIGDKSNPRFSRMEEPFAQIRVGRGAAPALASIATKDATDLLVGNFAGNLLFFTRDGGARSLNFKLQDRKFLGLDVGVSSTPVVADIDADGVPDLVIGSDAGPLTLYQKAATEKNPLAWKKGPEYFKGLKIPPGSTPRFVDIDGDGDQDLIVGTAKGTMLFFRNDAGKEGESSK